MKICIWLLIQGVKAYMQFLTGDFDSIDMEAVKAYMNFKGMSVEELSDLIGLGAAGVDEINSRLEN